MFDAHRGNTQTRSMLASCTLPWTRSAATSVSASEADMIDSTTLVENERNDSAFHEPEYSNPASFESSATSSSGSGQENSYQNQAMILSRRMTNHKDLDFIPDYEEVDPVQVRQLREALQKSSIHKDIYANARTITPVMDNNKERIMQATIYCIHKESGCTWSGPLHGLKAHLNVCSKDALDCLNNCGAKIARSLMEDHMLYTCSKRLVTCSHCKKDFTGAVIEDHNCGFEPVDCELKCGLKVQRNRLKAHQINTCSKRLIACSYCGRDFTADTLQAHHSKCTKFPVPCPFRCGTSDSLIREEIEIHLKNFCPLANCKDCVFREAGCRFRGNDGLMKAHMDEARQVHLDLMCSLAHKQQDLIKRLNDDLEKSTTSYNGVLVWKIKDLKARLAEAKTQDGLELVSAPFYTSQYGYRVQASLFLNGNGGGEGQYLSAYIKLLPGEYDSILKWPFRHTVSFTLLDQADQRKDACNIVESFIPDPTWKNFQRPSKMPDPLGFGFPKFVPHEIMLKTRNYVRDDCIFIKIRVDPSRNVAV